MSIDPVVLLVIILLVLWAAGFHFAIGGGLIHVLVIVALIVLIYRIFSGRKPLP